MDRIITVGLVLTAAALTTALLLSGPKTAAAYTILAQEPDTRPALERRHHAAPSPDGRQMSYHATRNGVMPSLYISNIDGTNERLLWGSPTTIEQEPRWSPDGKWISFVTGTSYENGQLQLGIIKPNGTDYRVLTNVQLGMVKGPSWSPGSQKILYEVRDSDSGISTLHIHDLAHGKQRQLTDTSHGMLVQAEWSPDGNSILASKRLSNNQSVSDLYIFPLDNPDSMDRLTFSPEGETMPVWAPDASAVAFARSAPDADQYELFLYRLSDKTEQRLTSTDSIEEFFPIFSADGSQLFYDAVIFEGNNAFSTIRNMPVEKFMR